MTEITLKDYIDTRISDLEKKFCCAIKDLEKFVDIKEKALDKRLEVASEGLNKRLEGMNEFRQQLDRQATHFIPRVEYALQVEKYDLEVRGLRESRALLEGKASQKQVNLALVMTVVSIAIAIFAIAIPFIKS